MLKNLWNRIKNAVIGDFKEDYLNNATDIVDLEHRIRSIEYSHYK